jgi:hypothetical protein
VLAEQRPKDEDYDRYVFLVDLFRRLRYDEAAIFDECPFLVQDVLFNAILCRSDGDLAEIAGLIGEDGKEIEEWRTAIDRALRQDMWSEERRQFEPIDMVAGEKIPTCTASSFMPLFSSSASKEQAEELYRKIDSASFCALHQGNCFTIPNYDMTTDDFDSRDYWRGPVWININWMLSQGLRNYGYREKSDAMKKDLVQLPIRFGFHEYFDSITGKGYGSDTFSPDDIEHGILRSNARPPYRLLPVFSGRDPKRRYTLGGRDNRIQFALVCGSRSCAPIRFYESTKIDEQLDMTARNFVNSSEVVVLPEENLILLSQIFQWYSKDFGGRERVVAFLLNYLDPGTARDHLARHGGGMKMEHLFYDWNLNH